MQKHYVSERIFQKDVLKYITDITKMKNLSVNWQVMMMMTFW